MGEESIIVTQSLLVGEGHGDVGGKQQNSSSVTTTLVLSTLVAACITFGVGCVLGYSSPTQSVIMEDVGLSLAEFSLFGSMLNLGSILGALASGKTTDLLGRKGTMWVLNLFYIVGWLAISLAKVPWLLDVGKLLQGFRNGIAVYLVPIYLAEITPKNLRGRFTALIQMMGVMGLSMMYIIVPFINWRILALIGIIPSLLQFPLLLFIPESPRWLAKAGREKEFETALLSLRGKKASISEEATAIKIGIGLMALQHLGGANAYAYYSGVVFVSAGLSKYVGLSTLAVVEIIMSIVGASLIDKFGRRALLLVSSGGLCSGSFLTRISFLLQDHQWWSEGTPFLALLSLWLYMGSYQVGMEGNSMDYCGRGAAGSIASLIGQVCSWIVSYNFNFLLQWSSAGTLFIFSAICGLNLIFIAKMVPETKRGTLEEIQVSITSSSQ